MAGLPTDDQDRTWMLQMQVGRCCELASTAYQDSAWSLASKEIASLPLMAEGWDLMSWIMQHSLRSSSGEELAPTTERIQAWLQLAITEWRQEKQAHSLHPSSIDDSQGAMKGALEPASSVGSATVEEAEHHELVKKDQSRERKYEREKRRAKEERRHGKESQSEGSVVRGSQPPAERTGHGEQECGEGCQIVQRDSKRASAQRPRADEDKPGPGGEAKAAAAPIEGAAMALNEQDEGERWDPECPTAKLERRPSEDGRWRSQEGRTRRRADKHTPHTEEGMDAVSDSIQGAARERDEQQRAESGDSECLNAQSGDDQCSDAKEEWRQAKEHRRRRREERRASKERVYEWLAAYKRLLLLSDGDSIAESSAVRGTRGTSLSPSIQTMPSLVEQTTARSLSPAVEHDTMTPAAAGQQDEQGAWEALAPSTSFQSAHSWLDGSNADPSQFLEICNGQPPPADPLEPARGDPAAKTAMQDCLAGLCGSPGEQQSHAGPAELSSSDIREEGGSQDPQLPSELVHVTEGPSQERGSVLNHAAPPFQPKHQEDVPGLDKCTKKQGEEGRIQQPEESCHSQQELDSGEERNLSRTAGDTWNQPLPPMPRRISANPEHLPEDPWEQPLPPMPRRIRVGAPLPLRPYPATTTRRGPPQPRRLLQWTQPHQSAGPWVHDRRYKLPKAAHYPQGYRHTAKGHPPYDNNVAHPPGEPAQFHGKPQLLQPGHSRAQLSQPGHSRPQLPKLSHSQPRSSQLSHSRPQFTKPSHCRTPVLEPSLPNVAAPQPGANAWGQPQRVQALIKKHTWVDVPLPPAGDEVDWAVPAPDPTQGYPGGEWPTEQPEWCTVALPDGTLVPINPPNPSHVMCGSMKELIKTPRGAIPAGFYSSLQLMELPANCLELIIQKSCDGEVQRGLVMATVCQRFRQVLGGCCSWNALTYGPDRRGNPRPFDQLNKLLLQGHPRVERLRVAPGFLQYVPRDQSAVLSRLTHLELLMEQLGFGVGPPWQLSDILDAAGSLPRLESLALQLLKPTPASNLVHGRLAVSSLDATALEACPRLRSLTLLTDCQRHLQIRGLASLHHLTHLSLSAHTVSVDLHPGSEGPHWPPPALIDMQLSAYSPPRLRELGPQDAPAALASGIPSITCWIKSETGDSWGSTGEALPAGLLECRPDLCCLFKPSQIYFKKDRNGSGRKVRVLRRSGSLCLFTPAALRKLETGQLGPNGTLEPQPSTLF